MPILIFVKIPTQSITTTDKMVEYPSLKVGIDKIDNLYSKFPAGRNVSNLKIVITEINRAETNTADGSWLTSAEINGIGNNSFSAGQWWVNVMAEAISRNVSGEPIVDFMEFWSVKESLDMGYILSEATNTCIKPNYVHYSEMANNFSGKFYMGTVNCPTEITSGYVNRIKAFGSVNDKQISVMILNQSTNGHTFDLNLAGASFMTTPGLQINLNMGVSKEYYYDAVNTSSYKASYFYIPPNSSMSLKFDCSGNIASMSLYQMSDAATSAGNGTPDIGFQTVAITTITGTSIPTLYTSLTANPASCPNFNDGSVTINGLNGAASINWYAMNSTTSFATATNMTPGAYTAEISMSGCSNDPIIVPVVIPSPSYPVVPELNSRNFCTSGSLTFNATVQSNSGGSYSWSGGQTSPSITVTPTSTTTYTVTVNNNPSNGCSVTKSVTANLTSILKDAYIQDSPFDVGNQPDVETINNYGGVTWASTDVWVRNFPDAITQTLPDRFATENQHQNPEWTPNAQNTPFIYVKIRNRGCTTLTGKVDILFANASASLTWGGTTSTTDGFVPANSLAIGATAPSLTLLPGEEGVVSTQWLDMATVIGNPNSTGVDHFCFAARYETNPISDDPANGEDVSEGAYSVGNSTYSGNNFAWKNVTIVNADLNNIAHPPHVLVGNPLAIPMTTCLAFKVTNDGTNGSIIENGGINVDLGPTLYARWVAGGKQGSGIQESPKCHLSVAGICLHRHLLRNGQPAVNSPYEVKIVSPDASLENLYYPAKQMDSIKLNFNFSSSGNSKGPVYTYDLIQSMPKDGNSCSPMGGERYIINRPTCPTPNAGDDITTGRGCPATLTATPYIVGATYNWYNSKTGVLIDTGATIHVSPIFSTTYELEMKSSYGCIDYDTVRVNISTTSMCPIKNYALSCPAPGVSPKQLVGIITNPTVLMKYDTAYVTGLVTIANFASLTLENMIVVVAPGGGFKVDPGGRLIIKGSVLSGCSGQIWSGINVTGTNNDPNQLYIEGTQMLNVLNPIKTDYVKGANIINNVFAVGTTGVYLKHNKEFIVNGNYFEDMSTGIHTEATLPNTASQIQQNYFMNADVGVSFKNDNHATLSITCNTFDGFKQYGIYSDNTTLKNQGTLLNSAGNLFINSTSTMTNAPLLHNGLIPMTYYYDAAHPLTLVTGVGLTAFALPGGGTSCGTSREAQIEPTVSPESMANQNHSVDYKLYPNPNTGLMTFEYKLSEGESGMFVIYDMTGRVVAKYPLVNGATSIGIKEEGLQNGLYFYSAIVNGVAIKTEKLIINK